MSHTGIVPKDPFSTNANRKNIVFECLYSQYKKNGRGLSRKELAENVGVSLSTVHRALTDLQKKPYTRGTSKYNIMLENGLYFIVKELDEDRIQKLYENAIATLADKKAFTNDAPIEINSNLISFEVKNSCCKYTKKVLQSFFRSTYILDIAIHSKGLYILLKDGKSIAQKEELKRQICDFYGLVVSSMEKNKKLNKISCVKAKNL